MSRYFYENRNPCQHAMSHVRQPDEGILICRASMQSNKLCARLPFVCDEVRLTERIRHQWHAFTHNTHKTEYLVCGQAIRFVCHLCHCTKILWYFGSLVEFSHTPTSTFYQAIPNLMDVLRTELNASARQLKMWRIFI